MSERVQKLRELGTVTINLPGQRLGLGNRVLTTELPFALLWNVSETIHEIGLDRAMELIIFADRLRNLLAGVEGIHDQARVFDGVMVEVLNMLDLPPTSRDTRKDRVLALTYHLLRSRSISHARAADLASRLLGTEFSEDAWRMRLNRWIKRHNLEKVGQRKRRT